DVKLLRRMIRTFREDSVKKLADMKRAIARENGMALATAAHALKGSSAIFAAETGSERATQCAQQLQQLGRKDDLTGAAAVLKELEREIAQLNAKLRGYDVSADPGGGILPNKSRRAIPKRKSSTR